MMLNDIATRYGSAPRIIMEYVDNALDDAEQDFNAELDGSYARAVEITVEIDREARQVRVQDNGRGMSKEQLLRLVQNIGDSQKRNVSWVNGRFG